VAEPLSPERLAQIRRRVENATPLPWTPSSAYPHICWQGDDQGEQIISANLSERPAEDIDFIAHARQDVPALLGEVERLRGELDDLRGQNAMTESSFDAYAEQAGHDLAELRKENERLRAVRNAALARLGRAEQVMQLAVDQVEHFEAVHYLKRFLDERPGSGGGS
jgi:DNA repair exonuclease SbcCD ATPase subunit